MNNDLDFILLIIQNLPTMDMNDMKLRLIQGILQTNDLTVLQALEGIIDLQRPNIPSSPEFLFSLDSSSGGSTDHETQDLQESIDDIFTPSSE